MGRNKWDDHYARLARKEKWLARSVYKLKEIDKKFQLIRKGDLLLDLGCYPGSWSQYGLDRVGAKGEVIGIDLTRPNSLSVPGFRFIQADILTLDPEWLLKEVGLRDVVMSDLAPQTTGIKSADLMRSMELAARAAEIALTLLKTKGHFVCKVFEGEDFKSFRQDISADFKQVRTLRPKAVRKRSKEVYLIGLSRA